MSPVQLSNTGKTPFFCPSVAKLLLPHKCLPHQDLRSELSHYDPSQIGDPLRCWSVIFFVKHRHGRSTMQCACGCNMVPRNGVSSIFHILLLLPFRYLVKQISNPPIYKSPLSGRPTMNSCPGKGIEKGWRPFLWDSGPPKSFAVFFLCDRPALQSNILLTPSVLVRKGSLRFQPHKRQAS